MNKRFRKILATALICTLALPSVAFANVFDNDYTFEEFKTDLQIENDFEVFMDDEELIPEFITGFESEEVFEDEDSVELFINGKKELFELGSSSFDVISEDADELNTTHYKTVQKIDNIPVYGGEMIVHTNENGKVYAINGNAVKNIEKANWNSKFKMNAKKAIAAATESMDVEADNTINPAAEKFIYPFEGTNYAVYLVTLPVMEPEMANYKVFVNAENGEIIDFYNAMVFAATTGTGKNLANETKTINLSLEGGTYYMKDLTRGNGILVHDLNGADEYSLPGTVVSNSTNTFNETKHKSAVDTMVNLGISYDYFKNVHGRNSYDNAGKAINGSVHYKTNENNAFWWNGNFVFGDGDGSIFSPLAGSLDVVAHEFTHAVTQYTCNLEYRNQSGAFNETLSDVFGAIVEQKATGESNWWLVGEDCTTPNKAGDGLRDMKDPGGETAYSKQPAHMTEFKNVTYDNGGVHINSGITNKAFYNIATVIGLDKSGAIYYRAMTKYFTASSDFAACRNGLIQAAKDLHGADSAEHIAVQNGFAAVGIGAAHTGGGTTPPGDKTWTTENVTIESAHNYANYTNQTKTYTKAGAEKVSVHFVNLRVESGYDFVYVMDKNDNVIKKITGNADNTWVEVPGDTVKIKLETDYSVTDWGYKVDQIKNYK